MSTFASRLRHVGRHRPRLLGAAAIGIVSYFLLPAEWTRIARLLVAWNIAIWPYLLAIVWLMIRTSTEGVRGIAKQEDASSVGLMAIMSSAAVLSMVAIMAELARGQDAGESAWFVYGITSLTVAGSWLLLGVLYTFHYAHLYYSSPQHRLPLAFPEGLKSPSYVDFLYFAFTIAAAIQTSDVSVRTTSMRATVLAHTLLSFFFNLGVLGLCINIAASLAGGK